MRAHVADQLQGNTSKSNWFRVCLCALRLVFTGLTEWLVVQYCCCKRQGLRRRAEVRKERKGGRRRECLTTRAGSTESSSLTSSQEHAQVEVSRQGPQRTGAGCSRRKRSIWPCMPALCPVALWCERSCQQSMVFDASFAFRDAKKLSSDSPRPPGRPQPSPLRTPTY